MDIPSANTLVPSAEVFTPRSCMGSIDKLVVESTISEQGVGSRCAQPCLQCVLPCRSGHHWCILFILAGGLGSFLDCFSRATTSPVSPTSSFPTVDATGFAGCKDAPWELLQCRRDMCHKAVASPTLKTRPPPPVWLHGRCHRCHEVGHWVAICCDPLSCDNCLQLGHKAKYCMGKTDPHPLWSKIFIVPGR
jgi:hypothetical protein